MFNQLRVTSYALNIYIYVYLIILSSAAPNQDITIPYVLLAQGKCFGTHMVRFVVSGFETTKATSIKVTMD